MTENEFLDNMKKRGIIVYQCLQCSFRGVGAAVTYHEMATKHTCQNETKVTKRA